MATWKTYRIHDAINDIDEEVFVLPVIQRKLVWDEDKMALLFDTLLKGDSFGGIMVIEEEKDSKPLFNFRPFTKDGHFIPSSQIETLSKKQYFVIDGQQRLQSFYIGLKGSINGKSLYFDLFSDFTDEYEFKFESDETKLPKITKDNLERPIANHLWQPVKPLLQRLKDTNDDEQVTEEICERTKIVDETQRKHISRNIRAFYRNVINAEVLGVSTVFINKSVDEIENKQRIVELFRRLNDGGTKLSPFDLVASILKGFSWDMEAFLDSLLSKYEDIGLNQDNLIKLIFLLQDNHSKEMASIEASDARFAIDNKQRISAILDCLVKFLENAKLHDYYKTGNRSFIPLFFIAYHIFHKDIPTEALPKYFDNFDTSNTDFNNMKSWLYHSLLNGIFKSKGAGWIPYKTGVRKLLNEAKNHKNSPFPKTEYFSIYYNHPLVFSTTYSNDGLDKLDQSFLFYVMYDCKNTVRTQDIDHIMPRNILEGMSYESDLINSIKNYQLLDTGTNRGAKNGKPFKEWINNPVFVTNKVAYITRHLIPNQELIWDEKEAKLFTDIRGQLILEKIVAIFDGDKQTEKQK